MTSSWFETAVLGSGSKIVAGESKFSRHTTHSKYDTAALTFPTAAAVEEVVAVIGGSGGATTFTAGPVDGIARTAAAAAC